MPEMINFRPITPDGYVYYVRMKTPIGIFYKLGFTKQLSVQDRFNYGGSDNGKLIDKELCMVYLEDAYDVEQALHLHFCGRQAFPRSKIGFPLYGSGQTELYFKDILGLDSEYSPIKRWTTSFRVLYKSCTDLFINPFLGFVAFLAFAIAMLPLLLWVWLVKLLFEWADNTDGRLGKKASVSHLIDRLR